MRPPSPERTHHLADFADFLAAVDEEGLEFVVIGGCAVGAYSHLLGQVSLTQDLDLYADRETLTEFILWSQHHPNLKLVKSPQPRSLQVAVLDWNGLEINVLSSSPGLPTASQAFRSARFFKTREPVALEVPLVDPFTLLSNKLAVNRPKDQPHIEILKRFLEEEVVNQFLAEGSQRDRLAAARALLETTSSRTLPEKLVARLLPRVKTSADLRFLVNSAPTKAQATAALEKASPPERNRLETIFRHRNWDC